VVREVVIAPTLSTALVHPWGSHPDLDPCWSLPELRVTHHDSDEPRWRRLARVSANPLALGSLQVCWQGTRQRNCGRCEKCLRTMTALEVSGHHDAIEVVFDAPLRLEAIGPHLEITPHPWCETIDQLDEVGLAADPWRQRWETVQLRPRPGLTYQDRAIQPRIPIAADPAIDLRVVGRRLASLGLRIDHGRTPADEQVPALVIGVAGPGRAVAEVRLPTDPPVAQPAVALDDLTLADLVPLLHALGVDPSDAVVFDPDGQPPRPSVR
jgi:hypothetical protein